MCRAVDQRLEREQHPLHDVPGRRRRYSGGVCDGGPKTLDHGGQLGGGVFERDERSPVVEQHGFDVRHPNIYPERVPKRVSTRLTHLDSRGAARMVDVAAKSSTVREALAECVVRMAPATVDAVREGTAKGDALAVARVAGIMAAKRTPDLI